MTGRPPTATSSASFLDGVRVLEAGDGVAGSSATAILATLGARVTKIARPDVALRRLRPALADGRSLLAAVLDDGKEIVDGATGADLLAHSEDFDVVICDRIAPPAPPVPVALADYLPFVATRNRGVWVTVSASGLDGPGRGRFGTELTVAAAGGLLSAVMDPRTGQPLKLAGNQALLSAGQVAALAACHGLDLVRRGPPVHLDVSAQEAVLATGPVLRVAHALLNCTGDAGAKRYGAPAGFYPCQDGVIRISAMENHQWEGLVRALGDPAWAAPLATTSARTEHAALIDEKLGALTATMTKRACEEILQAHGVPATAMNSPDELLASPQFAAREALRTVDAGGTSVTAVGPPVRRVDPPGRSEPSPATGLAGTRVVEAGHVLAVPLAGALLGAMGAHVTKLEDPERLDMYRRRGPFIDSTPGIERAAYFASVNHSKQSRSVTLDDAISLRPILDDCDVVIENFGPGRARRLGVDAAGLGGRRPSVLALSSSGFGHTGPWSAYRAYAYNLQTSCGLGYLTRTTAGTPVEIDMAWADLISAYAIATIVAAWAVGPAGRTGAALDFSMAELIAWRFNEFLAAASCGTDVIEGDRANEQYPYAPNGVYPTAGGADWMALSVASDEEWERTKDALGRPPQLDDPRFATAESRFGGRDALDGVIAGLTAGRDAAEIVAALDAVGVPAAAVAVAATLIADPHLAARGFFTEVEHPEWGRRRLIGLPWRIAGQPAFALTAPPLLDAVGSVVEGAGTPAGAPAGAPGRGAER